ncbi:hypothetical protein [Kordia sp.]|uniref:hypothetical protein n=1 Tax=Kordia sp. TaxID=1965332 RepID=UPI003D28800D
MATLKGALRSYGATLRRIEREQKRKAREAAKKFKEQQKLQDIRNAEKAVSDWNNYVSMLTSVHKNCTESIDWNLIENTEKPIEPEPQFINETIAHTNLKNYKPSFIDSLLGSSKKQVVRLELLAKIAIKKDKEEYELAYDSYLNELEEWEELNNICIGVKKKNIASYKDAIKYFDPFSDLNELGTQIGFIFDEDYIDINLYTNSLDTIPNYELKQTSTGKLSKREMPKTKFNELYQDHICSATLRVAREIFAYLPLEHVRINAVIKMVDTSTGHLKDQIILSVLFVPETIENLNLNTIDPSDSMINFIHTMNFNKTKGFKGVEKAIFET